MSKLLNRKIKIAITTGGGAFLHFPVLKCTKGAEPRKTMLDVKETN